jgi:hypothetical protein
MRAVIGNFKGVMAYETLTGLRARVCVCVCVCVWSFGLQKAAAEFEAADNNKHNPFFSQSDSAAPTITVEQSVEYLNQTLPGEFLDSSASMEGGEGVFK